MEYEYSSVDRIKTPHNYMYTSYHGKPFLLAYIKDRTDKIDFNQNKSLYEIFVEILAMLEKSTKGITTDVDKTETVFILRDILKNMITNEKQNSVYAGLSRFIKRYEVTKKVYAYYDENGKAYGSYDALKPYLYLSLACLVYFSKYKNLKMLNCALKLGDVFSSRSYKIKNKKLLRLCFQLEINSVDTVMEKAGIKI